MSTITVTWIECIDIGYGDYAQPERDIEIEWEGPIDPEAISREVDSRVNDRWTNFDRIIEIYQNGESVWYDWRGA